MRPLLVSVVAFFIFSVVAAVIMEPCNLPENLRQEIRSYKPIVDSVIREAVNGSARWMTYDFLKDFIDAFGPRLSGTKNLENAIRYINKTAKKEGLRTKSQKVKVPYWTRGHESVTMLSPRKANIDVIGLGPSVPTPINGIQADVIVVRSFDELHEKRRWVRGRIVVLYPEWTNYHDISQYRRKGASAAARFGALAVLVRSASNFTMGLPHTGSVDYEPDIPKIPAACISIEDAAMLYRMQERGSHIVLNVNLQSTDHGMKTSRNLLLDYPGRELPHKYVFVSGHIDSWDVGEGALDDGGGFMVSFHSLVLMRKLLPRPRRTVRALIFTGEEQGLYGAEAYKAKFNDRDIVLAIESDGGVFNPTGLLMHGTHEARCIVHEVLQLLEPINATTLEYDSSPGSDITVWANTEVPTAALRNDNGHYFWFHHSKGDRMEVLSPEDIRRCLAVFTAVSYVVADLSYELPRNIVRPVTEN